MRGSSAGSGETVLGHQRVRAQASTEIPVAAEDYWRVLVDWPQVANWMRVEGRPVPLIASPLKDGHRVDRLPCTRLATFDIAAPERRGSGRPSTPRQARCWWRCSTTT